LHTPQNAYIGGVLSGLGNPTTPDALLLAFDFGGFHAFFSCQTECDSFPWQKASGLGNYQLYSTGADSDAPCCVIAGPDADVPEPASIALLGIGLVGVGLSRRKRH
jgi:hypothetical protein